MLKRFKVWTYKEGEPPLFHNGPMSYVYAIEGHLMNELESGKSPFKARNPNKAHVFMLPTTVTYIVSYLYKALVTYARDQLIRTVTDYTNIISHKYPYWNRSNGADHFLASCHDWAPDVSRKKPGIELYKNLIRVLCNANTSEGFEPARDVSMPEMNIRRRYDLNPPMVGQHPQNRPILAFFAGRLHGRIREILLDRWKGKDGEMQVYDLLPKHLNYQELMGKSKFCLCPSGYEVASPRLVESINAGCVPVIISDYYELPFSDVLDWTKFSIFIPPKNISEIKTLLKGVSQARYLKLYKMVIRVRRHFQLNRPAKPFDVLHMIIHSVWLRRLNVKISH
ncbi:hypothetical protein L6164_011440 [Bauhinia variegata]|uniref:Uncharacterized protein n=1 Tax=Bauhinia variegata TaxID=167791 RepID=A0ACB9P796_BAUVA|nr:hypothetical protein L6164_011440 [Bauhinia variegata]